MFPQPQPKHRRKLGQAPEICQASPPFPSCRFAPHRCATPLVLCPILEGRNRGGLFSEPGAWGSPWCFGSDLGTEDPGRILQTRHTLVACVKTPNCANTSFKQAASQALHRFLTLAPPIPNHTTPNSTGIRLSSHAFGKGVLNLTTGWFRAKTGAPRLVKQQVKRVALHLQVTQLFYGFPQVLAAAVV